MIKRIDAGRPGRKSSARKSRMTEAPILEPRYDSRQSFYGKAYYTEPARDGSITLYSYETPVVRICADGEVELLPAWDYSATTLRHVKEFLKQQGYSAGSKAEIARMYTEVNESTDRNKRRTGAKVEVTTRPRRRRIAEGNEYGYVSLKNINVQTLAKEVNSAIADLVDEIDTDNAYSTYHWEIGTCDEGAVVVALGFAGGFEPNENEFTDKYGDAISIKFGILADDSAMAEYDMDIIMPYGENGDVWDSETSITSFDATSDVKWVVKEAKAWAKSVNSGR